MAANAMAALGEPVTRVAASIEASFKVTGGNWQGDEAASQRYKLKLLVGDLDGAIGEIRTWHRSWLQHFPNAKLSFPISKLAAVYSEAKQDRKAVAIAQMFVERAPSEDHRFGTIGRMLDVDGVPAALEVMAAAGAIDNVRWQQRLQTWIQAAEAKQILEPDARYLWPMGYARAVHSPAEASLAVAELDTPPRLPRDMLATLSAADVGRAYLLAGKLREAEAWLKRGAADCFVFSHPIKALRARASLGDFWAAKGEKDKACAQYKDVLARWPDPKPGSRTVDKVRSASQALGCGS